MPDQTRNLNSVTDFTGTLDSNDRIIMTDNKASLKALTTAILGKAMMEGYTESSLAGSSQSVKSAIDTLNSNTTPQIKTVSYTAGENINVRALTCVKMGKLVELNFYFDTTAQIINNAHFVDITDGLPKPIGNYATGIARAVNGSFTLVSLERRAHDDCLQSWGTTPVGTYYYAKLLYITDEE